MKPPTPYFGSKATIAPWIVSLLPRHEHYVEPFAGSLAVLLAKRPSLMETVNDLDGDLMTFWQVLRDRPQDLVRVCELTPHSRGELDHAWEPTEDELERARRVWVRLTQGRSGTMRRTGWRHYKDPQSSLSMPGYLEAYRKRLLPVAERIADVSLECRPALELIAAYGSRASVLLYVDPPYLGTVRGSSNSNYGVEMRTDAQHRELAAALWDCTATVLLSGYASPLYDELYEGWHRYTAATWTANATSDKARTEVVWSNRPLAGQPELDLFATV